VFSSRKIEQATYDSVAFRYVAVNTHPDHDTIATFRRRFLKQLKVVFTQILMIAHEMGVMKLGTVSLDGTKIKANASKHHALSWQYARKLEKQLKKEIKELLHKAQKADKEDVPEGMNIPEELARRESRLEAIAAAKDQIEQRATERFSKEQQAYEAKLAERKAKAKSRGRKPRGRPPKPPEPGPKNKDQINLTDSDSRIMPSSSTDSMLIVENHITQQSNDKQELAPALTQINSLPDNLGAVDTLLADAGYFSKDNVKCCIGNHVFPYIAPNRQRHNPSLEDRFTEPDPLPAFADPVTEMTHRLKTVAGKAIYAKRKSTVEPVFGIIKAAMGFRQFLLRGLELVAGEWNLVCVAYNIKRLHALCPI
jgi:hypothetical protein